MQIYSSDRQKNVGHSFILLIQILSVLLIWLGSPLLIEAFRAETLILPACITVAGISIWSVWSWRKMTRSFFDPYILFFLAAVLFNAGQAFLEIFGLNKDGLLAGRFSPDILVQSVLLVALALGAFHAGGLLAAVSHRKNESDPASALIFAQSTRNIGWILLAISFVPSLAVLRDAIDVVLAQGYFALFQRESGTSFEAIPQLLGTFLVPATLFLLAGSREQVFSRRLSLLIMGFYGLVQLFLGHRSTAFLALLAYIWLWHKTIRPVSKTFLLIAAALILLITPLIAQTRNTAGEDRLSLSYLVERFTSIENPAISAISEMGGTLTTVAHTIRLVPSTRDFDYGVDYLYATLTVFPNFIWKVHPTIERGTPSSWLIWTVNPYTAERGGGLGYSFIAEAYFNFGWLGTPIVMITLGFFFARFVLWAQHSNKPERAAALASFIPFFLFFVRQEAAGVVRSLVWYALIPYLGVHLVMPTVKKRLNLKPVEYSQ